ADRLLREHPGYDQLRLAIEKAETDIDDALWSVRAELEDEIKDLLVLKKQDLERAHEQSARVMEALHRLYEQARKEISDIELPEINIPEPEIDTEAQPEPLFTTNDDFVTASRKLIGDKALDEES